MSEKAKKLPEIDDVVGGISGGRVVSISRGGIPIEALAFPLPENEVTEEVAGDARLFLQRTLRDVDDPSRPFASTPDEIARYLATSEIEVLRKEVEKVQATAVPYFDSKSATAFLALSKESGKRRALVLYRAANATALHAFFGVPAMKVTDAQVLYYMGLMLAYNERVEQEKGRGVE